MRDLAAHGKEFWLHSGRQIRSIKELRDALRYVDDSIFYFHVTSQKNDFANWIRDVFEEHDLAFRINEIRGRERMIDALSTYIHQQSGGALSAKPAPKPSAQSPVLGPTTTGSSPAQVAARAEVAPFASPVTQSAPVRPGMIGNAKDEPNDQEISQILDRINKILEEEKRIEDQGKEILRKESLLERVMNTHREPIELVLKGIMMGLAISIVMIIGYTVLFT
ncbi:hypothetical protein COY28_06205 [Candidatus Woesearchaeota archaeon CG_4_10_14_0_2_um_filter_57_5]|nr:MAG: hypothetical protein AUJ68_06940 [Candidatus Woesearchaeota archaeon CG1_02_57_44]PIN67755.1 MAG: hypothetical protein COV94_06745 [Candidatus Woesearchaeota archaeon CG11_big_fil_rev_8_21_14_0_20_57_5]PIZ49538.1 MAG: hypothetical protein COY28_06205 [Candidatus Woesearchaeota archaeon CG_4_10_14_0_2_um_filter_57_5]